MPKFLSKIFNSKKIVFFVLFLIIGILIVPQVIYADCFTGAAIGAGVGLFASGVGAVPGAAVGCITGFVAGKAIANAATNLFAALMMGISNLIYYIFWGFASFVVTVYDQLIPYLLQNSSITKDTIFLDAWADIRNFANMFIVLGFIVAGIATALRINEYGAKKLLPKLIIVALLINFSGLIVGIGIDGSNILTNFFLQKDDAGSGITVVDQITIAANNIDWNTMATNAEASDKGDWTSYVGDSILFASMYAVTAITFIYMMAILFERQAMLAILFILSPLALAAYIFPVTQKYSKMWWEHFLKWLSIGAAIALFIWVGTNILNSIPGVSDSGGSFEPGAVVQQVTMFQLLIPLIFFFIASKIAKSSGSVVAGAVIGLAKGASGVAMGVVTGGTSLAGAGAMAGLDKLTGGRASSAKQAISSKTGRFLESMNLRKTGTTASNEASAVSQEQKGMDAALSSGNAADRARVQQLAKTGTGKKGAAAMAAVVSAGQINDTFKDASGRTDLNQVSERLSYAESFGAPKLRDDAQKTNPGLARLNGKKVADLYSGKGTPDGKGFSTSEQAQQEAVNQATAKLTRSDMEKLHPDAIDEYTISAFNQQQLGWAFERGSPAVQSKILTYGTPGTDEYKKANDTKRINGMTSTHQKNHYTNMAYLQKKGEPETISTEVVEEPKNPTQTTKTEEKELGFGEEELDFADKQPRRKGPRGY